jgi:hypothetical protein
MVKKMGLNIGLGSILGGEIGVKMASLEYSGERMIVVLKLWEMRQGSLLKIDNFYLYDNMVIIKINFEYFVSYK